MLSLVYVEETINTQSEFGIANAYRIVGVESHVHRRTRVRGMLASVDIRG